ncbi:hypothetical protein KQI84_15240 [bacterium]|nr:hypothetical protein [bacterium]
MGVPTGNQPSAKGKILFAITTLLSISLLAPAPAQKPPAEVAPPEEITLNVVSNKGKREFKDSESGRVTDLEQMPKGFWSHGVVNDTYLKNDLSLFVFGQVQGGGTATEATPRDGGLLDVTSSPASPEKFQLFQPNTGGGGKLYLQADSIDQYPEANGKAVVVVTSHDIRYPDLEARTEYTLEKDMPGVLVTTTLTNNSDEQIAEYVHPSDYIRWGATIPFIPGHGPMPMGGTTAEVEFMFGRQDDVWVLIAPETGTMNITHNTDFTTVRYGELLNMEPGETRSFRRWVLTSTQDPAHLFSYVLQRRTNQEYGTLVGRVVERQQAPDGAMIDKGPIPNCNIRILPIKRPDWDPTVERDMRNKPYLLAQTRANGQFECVLPVGEYRVYPAPDARLAPRPNYASRIKAGEVEAIDFGVSPPVQLVYEIVDADTGERMPGKLTFEPLRGSNSPEFGPPGDVLSMNTVLSSHGAGTVDVPPGNYRIVASHGPEYHTTEERMSFNSIGQVQKTFELRRAYETPGWISADVGVRTNNSPASRVSPEARVVSAVAEGVEWLVTGDPGQATDLSPAVARLGVGKWLTTTPGYRHTGETEPFLGDFLMFPTTICSTGMEPDFSLIQNADTSEGVIEAMRALCPEAAILLSRPIWPTIGYLSLQGYSMQESTKLPGGDWTKDFDAFQIWEGKRQRAMQPAYNAYHQMLRRGGRLTAFGNSNSYGTWNEETGYPRVYIRSETDDPAAINPEELARNIKLGQVTVTNGPFVNVKVNDRPMGSLITDTDGSVDLDIEVYAANWVQISSISININGQFVRRILLPSGTLDTEAGKVFPPADKPEDGRLTVKVKEDSILDVVVQGDSNLPMDPVNPFILPTRDSTVPRGQYALAVSAPVLIDTDGNGQLDPPAPDEDTGPLLPAEETDPVF